MYPVYTCMNSYPQQRNHMPPTHPYFPSFEAVPPQMTMDPPKISPVSYEPRPYGCNYGYPTPTEFHGCCNHSYSPGHNGYRPPHSHLHFQPPSPLPYWGTHPMFSEAYPFHYAYPAHYMMEQPRYEYDKSGPRYHCCGCSHNSCHGKDVPTLKIEEQEPYAEKKNGNSLVPVESRDYPAPIVWIPPEYVKNKEDGKPTESETKLREENGRVKASDEQPPRFWNGWFPFDMNSLASKKYGGEGNRTEKQRNEENNQFPFPIFWMPCTPNEVKGKDHRETNTCQKSIQELPSNSDVTNQLRETKEKQGSEVGSKTMEKDANRKTIPVKQLEEPEEKRTLESDDKKAGGITVKHIEGNEQQRSPKNTLKRQPSPPNKASKLPPVCLRVDPLPRRKNGSGTSRSPSPPGFKRSQELNRDSSKSTQQDLKGFNPKLDETKQEKPSEKGKRVIEVAEGMSLQDKGENFSISTNEEASKSKISGEGKKDMEERKLGEEIKSEDEMVKCQSGDGESEIKDDQGPSKVEEEKSEEVIKVEGKNLSEVEAALIIQSAYRGFEVRRLEPMKKLKQIAQVREEVVALRSRIQAPASSGIENDDRRGIIIGETIMSLLLKLDSIQGLHPSIRDVRKSVAKELVSLQETLDSLTITNSNVSSSTKTVEDAYKITGDDVHSQEQRIQAKEAGLAENSFQNNQAQPLSSQPAEASEFMLKETVEENDDVISVGQMAAPEIPNETNDAPDGEESVEVAEEGTDSMTEVVPRASSGVLFEEPVDDGLHDNEQSEQGIDVISQVKSNAPNTTKAEGPFTAESRDEVVSGKKDENLLEDGKLEVEPLGKELDHIDEFVKISEVEDYDKIASKDEVKETKMQQEIGAGYPVEASKPEGQENDVGDMGDSVEPCKLEQKESDVVKMVDFVEASKPEEQEHDVVDMGDLVEASNSEEQEIDAVNMGDLVEASKPEETIYNGENEGDLVEASKPEETIYNGEIEEDLGKIEPNKPNFELSFVDNEIKGELNEDHGVTDAVGNTRTANGVKEVTMEEREESNCAEKETREEDQKPPKEEVLLGSDLGGPEGDRKLIEENERLRKMMERLIETGKEQLTAISNLNGRVKDLEKKLARKRSKTRRFRASKNGSSCVKSIQ